MSARARREPRVPPSASTTTRRLLAELLRDREQTFEGLRLALRISRRALEDDLRHVERSARRAGERFEVTPAVCLGCGFVFKGREARHLHAPGRCPSCRGERIDEPRFRLV